MHCPRAVRNRNILYKKSHTAWTQIRNPGLDNPSVQEKYYFLPEEQYQGFEEGNRKGQHLCEGNQLTVCIFLLEKSNMTSRKTHIRSFSSSSRLLFSQSASQAEA